MDGRLLRLLFIASLAIPGVVIAEGYESSEPSAEARLESVSNYMITGNTGFVSDYVFNGISQSFRNPAIQGGFDVVHANGIYLGTWASSISSNQYTNASMEWDIYGGYNGKISDDLGYNVGLMQVMYPGGKAYNASPDSYKKWCTTEVIAGATFKGTTVKYTYTLTDWYGINTSGFTPVMYADGSSTSDGPGNLGSSGSGYLEVNYILSLTEGSGITVHVGHQQVRNFSKLNYTDYKLAVNRTYAGFNIGLAYTRTNASDNTLYHVIANGDDKILGAGILALSVGRSF